MNYYQLATSGNPVHVSACAVRRSVLAEGVRFRQNAPVGADQEFYVRAVLHSPLAYHPRVSSLYHRDVGASAMASARWSSELPLTAASLSQMLREDIVPVNLRASASVYLAWMIEQYALAGLGMGQKSGALSVFRQAQFQPIPDRCKRHLGWLERVVRRMPLPPLKLAVRFKQSRWYTAVAELLAKQTAPRSPNVCARATTRRHIPAPYQPVIGG
jgi:hypothetical protein